MSDLQQSQIIVHFATEHCAYRDASITEFGGETDRRMPRDVERRSETRVDAA